MPTTFRPCARYFACMSWNSENSLRQGTHHEAQKFTITGWPRSPESETRPGPRRRGRSKAGALLPAGAMPAAETGPEADDGAVPPPVSLDPPESACTIATTAIAARTTTATMTTAPTPRRDRRVPSDGADEGVDGNGREEQREVEVREGEQLDRALRGRVAEEPEGLDHEGHAEHGGGRRVAPRERRHRDEQQ